MRSHDAESVAKALDAAWREHRQWFPTLGQLVELVEMHEKSKTVSEDMRLGEGEPFSEPNGAEKVRDIIKNLSQDCEITQETTRHESK